MDETSYNWYKIFNKVEFEATGLVSKLYTLNFEDLGPKSILVTQGNVLGMTYEGTFLAIEFPVDETTVNPFEFEGYAALLDVNDDVWLGLPIEN